MYLFLARVLSSCCFFAFLANANVFLDTANNTVLVLGYRFFLVTTPLFLYLFRNSAPGMSFLVSLVGVFFWCNGFYFYGTIFISLGIAVGGFLLKKIASTTHRGAAYNKVALNLGSLLSCFVIIAITNEYAFYIAGAVLLCLSSCLCFFGQTPVYSYQEEKKQTTLQEKVLWMLLGFVVGVKLLGIFSILPQYLLSKKSLLPDWYPLMLLANSIIIIIFQVTIIKVVSSVEVRWVFISLAISIVVLTFPQLFFAETFWGALLWTCALSLCECVISYFDKIACINKSLLIKEAFVGLGGCTIVFSSRNNIDGNFVVGFVCIVIVMIAYKLYYRIYE